MIKRWEARQVNRRGIELKDPTNYRFFLKSSAKRRVKYNNAVVDAMESTKKLVHYKYVVVDRRTGDVVK